MQFKAAMEGNVTMLIWLGKQYLGQSNKQEVKATSDLLADLLAEFRNRYNHLGPTSEDHQLPEVIEAAPPLPLRMETAISRDDHRVTIRLPWPSTNPTSVQDWPVGASQVPLRSPLPSCSMASRSPR
jgi:hypothetical protein